MSDFLRKFGVTKSAVQDRLSSAHNESHSQPPPSYQRPPPLLPYWTADFNAASSVSREWRHELGDNGWGNNELQNYTDTTRNSFFSADEQGRQCLVLRAIADDTHLTSARLTSRMTLGRDRGYLSARITAPSARGIWPAFWLLPEEPFSWPTDGEVDIMESWNGERTNHSCLHWGHYNGPDHDKHRVVQTPVSSLDQSIGIQYGFAWDQSSGKLLWYIHGRPVMRAKIPAGTRKMADFQIKLNIAMGGNVVQGQRPQNGTYDMVVHEVGMFEGPPGGWSTFENHWHSTPEGHTI
ncbi:concanavalin A-like lectin/glucanase [Rhizodiscina lignyota]|uniref:Concanavalin A-like lectin/glucanase n=1 Tax=Rhizodiscina lignyota TaxID=1504668 RepID=A0A9P4IN39_9PEZI|nr:concanavalin A-like lectin/glucanase [Rhizodiscina lignyota]